MRLIVMLGLFAPLAQCQFDYPMPTGQYSGLAATDDGQQLYFSTALRLKGSEANVYQKIMRYVGQFEQFREVQPEGVPPAFDRGNFFRLIDPQVSGDGSVVAYTASRVCTCCSSCLTIPLLQGVIAGRHAGPDNYSDGRITLSGNDRFALSTGGNFTRPALIDLSTGTSTSLGNVIPFREQVLTDDGSVLVWTPVSAGMGPVVLRGLTASRVLNVSRSPVAACVSRNASKVVYEAEDAAGRALIAYDVSSGLETILAIAPLGGSSPYESLFDPHMTNDGRTVLFSSPDANGAKQEYLINTNGANRRQITAEPGGIDEATITGFGNIVFATSDRAGLLRIDVATGVRTELAPPTPAVKSISKAAVGSLAQLTGTGLAGISAVTVNNESVPMYPISDTDVFFQVPWLVNPDSPALIVFRNDSASPFESGVRTMTPAVNPSFFPLVASSDAAALASHQDFASIVTAENPAAPGEYLHFWMTGIGPVTGRMETGIPAPITGDPLQTTTTPFTCYFPDRGMRLPAPISFSGLAPGLVGIYQVDLQIPMGLSLSPARLWCDFPDNKFASANVPVRLAR